MLLALRARHFRVEESMMSTDERQEPSAPNVAQEAAAAAAEIEALREIIDARQAESARAAERLDDAIRRGNEILSGEHE